MPTVWGAQADSRLFSFKKQKQPTLWRKHHQGLFLPVSCHIPGSTNPNLLYITSSRVQDQTFKNQNIWCSVTLTLNQKQGQCKVLLCWFRNRWNLQRYLNTKEPSSMSTCLWRVFLSPRGRALPEDMLHTSHPQLLHIITFLLHRKRRYSLDHHRASSAYETQLMSEQRRECPWKYGYLQPSIKK